jgi:hypothetical protein
MVRVMAVDPASCCSCGGRGWKFLSLRRSLSSTLATGERRVVKRRRVTCLACGGTGSCQALPEVSA